MREKQKHSWIENRGVKGEVDCWFHSYVFLTDLKILSCGLIDAQDLLVLYSFDHRPSRGSSMKSKQGLKTPIFPRHVECGIGSTSKRSQGTIESVSEILKACMVSWDGLSDDLACNEVYDFKEHWLGLGLVQRELLYSLAGVAMWCSIPKR